MKAGKEYEILIEDFYKKLDPESKIKRNDKIIGHSSGIEREIDISIRHRVGPHEVLMIVQAKDYKNRVDVNIVGEFDAVIKDVRANKGVLISPKGFTAAALTMAKNLGIDALTAHDLSNPKWTIDLQMPIIIHVYEGALNFEFVMIANQAYADAAQAKKLPRTRISRETLRITEDGGKTVKTTREVFTSLCSNDGLMGFYDGKEHTVEYTGNNLQLYVMEGLCTPLRDFKFKFKVNRRLFYKYFEVKEFQGFINRHNNEISRANVKVEGDEFTLINFDVIVKKDIDLSHWLPYDDTIELIHPYKIKCAFLKLAASSAPLNFIPAGTYEGDNI